MDFVHDQLATGSPSFTRSRLLSIIDPRFNYLAEDVVQPLERICLSNGKDDPS
jgi:hypothetical protein